MKIPFRALVTIAIALCVDCSMTANSSANPGAPSAADIREVTILATPRKAIFTLAEPVYFDIVVVNRTDNSVTVPFLYDCIIEIDGSRYTQFPKPRVYDNDGKAIAGRVCKPHSETQHGTLTLGDVLKTLDAETGSVPLKLAAGKHSLELICGAYRSNRVEFALKE